MKGEGIHINGKNSPLSPYRACKEWLVALSQNLEGATY